MVHIATSNSTTPITYVLKVILVLFAVHCSPKYKATLRKRTQHQSMLFRSHNHLYIVHALLITYIHHIIIYIRDSGGLCDYLFDYKLAETNDA